MPTRQPSPGLTAAEDPSAVSDTPAWASRRWPAMGSTAEALVWGPRAEALAHWAVTHAARLEASWTRFAPDSELSRLNGAAGRGPASVSPTLWDALGRARDGWVLTGGAFDPTVGPALVALGYDRSFRALPLDGPAPAERLAVPGFGVVAFRRGRAPGEHAISVPADVGLDLGGVGKGLAADRLVEGLLRQGATSVCVSLGGDLRVGGPGPDADGTWSVPVVDPLDQRPWFYVPLRDGEALAQSTTQLRRWHRGGRELHHLVDPRTGQPTASDVVGAIVRDTEAWRAEVLAKATVVLGSARGLGLLERAGATGWLVDAGGTLHPSDDEARALLG